MQQILVIIRAAGIALGYAITLGCLYAARLFWIHQAAGYGTRATQLQVTAEAVLNTSPFILITCLLFALIAIPLAAWSVGSASWGFLKRYICGFWLLLALFIAASGNADGLILVSGAGLITLWFLRNRRSVTPTGIYLEDRLRIQMPPQMAGFRRNVIVLAILTVMTCLLCLYVFLGDGTKVYVAEISAIYIIACICQGLKSYPGIVYGRKDSR